MGTPDEIGGVERFAVMAEVPEMVVKVKAVEEKVEQKLIHWRTVVQSWVHSRKALIYLVTFVLVNVAFFMGKIDADHWTHTIEWSTLGYLGANVGDGLVSGLLGKKTDNS